MKSILLFFLSAIGFLDANLKEFKTYVCNTLPTLEGWCSSDKALNFIDLILHEKPAICVEIGIFGGASSFPAAATLKFLGQGRLINIDPWDKLECIQYFDPLEDAEHLKWWGEINLDRIYRSYLRMIKIHGLSEHCQTLKMTSEQAISHIDSIDILFIDGNNKGDRRLKDVQLYLPKVRSGGYIWINDASWPQTKSAIQKLQETCDFVKAIDKGNCLLFKKR